MVVQKYLGMEKVCVSQPWAFCGRGEGKRKNSCLENLIPLKRGRGNYYELPLFLLGKIGPFFLDKFKALSTVTSLRKISIRE